MRAALEGRGLQVVVAAGSLTEAVPQGGKRLKRPVRPDVRLTDADAADYSAIVFVGGWGASSYQYAFEGTYGNAIYKPVAPRIITGENPASAPATGKTLAAVLLGK